MSARIVAGALLLVALAGCARPIDEQLRRVTVDGQECIAKVNRVGIVDAIDCDWSNR